MNLTIIIPTYNRASCLSRAINSTLNQSHSDFRILVIDDGSTDQTRALLDDFSHEPRVSFICLQQNIGTAAAKNLGLALCPGAALTFHDSDDESHPHKLLLQVRALTSDGDTNEILDWKALDHEPGAPLLVDVAVGAHRFIKLDGSVHHIGNRISLVDDFFPTIQGPSATEGDWILINSGLFRRRVFQRLGGFLDSVEEDRELRNRLLASGHVFHFIAEPLLTKIEMPQSLTTDGDTGYRGARRLADRKEVWRRNRMYRNGCWGNAAAAAGRLEIDLNHAMIREAGNVGWLEVATDIPMTDATRTHLHEQLTSLQSKAQG